MENNTKVKSQLGPIILAVAIILGCVILTEGKITHKAAPESNDYEKKVKLTGDVSPVPIRLSTNGNDVTYYSELKIGNGEQLVVRLGNNDLVRITGENIVARFHHVARLLSVEYTNDGKKRLKYYNAPMAWWNE